jgi:1-acyl-sn-glycerol-3-phosphate acyltransferase
MSWLTFLITILLILISTGIIMSVARCGAGWRPWVCYCIARVYSAIMCRWKATNACTIPEFGPAIIVANHTSPADPVLLWIRHFASFKKKRLRVIGYLMAREYYDRRDFVGWVCRAMQSIPADRQGHDMAPVKEAFRRLQEGHLLGLFPEGRLNQETPDTQLLPGGTGVAWLALKSQVPLLPVFIHAAPRSKSMVKTFFVRTKTRVTYGVPIDLSAWSNSPLTHSVLAEATEVIMKAIADLGGISHRTANRERIISTATPAASSLSIAPPDSESDLST